MEWAVRIIGDAFDLDQFIKSLNNPVARIELDREGTYLLKSELFNGLLEHNEVSKKGNEILQLLKGTIRLSYGSDSSMRISGIYKIHDDGSIQGFLNFEERIAIRESVTIKITDSDGNQKEINTSDILAERVYLAMADEKVAQALRIFAREGHSWVGLYKIMEVVGNDLGNQREIYKNGWATEKSLKRFTHTANSFNAAGDDARHAIDKTQSPSDPMTIGEGKALIEFILNNWLMYKKSK